MKISRRTLPFVVLFISLLWGSAFPAIKAIYAEWELLGVAQSSSNRLLLAGVRFSIGGALLLLFARSPLAELRQTSRRQLLAFAVGQTYLQYLLFYTALAVSSAVLGGLLSGTGSIWWLILAPIMLKTPWPTGKQWALIGLAVTGVVIAVYKPGVGSGKPVLGAVLFCLTTLSGSLGVIALQKVLPTMGAKAATGFGLLIGGVMLILSGVLAWPDILMLFSQKIIFITLYLAGVSAVGFGLWNYLTGVFPVTLLAGYRFLVPVCAVIESSLLVSGEAPGAGIWLGGSLVLLALLALQKTKT